LIKVERRGLNQYSRVMHPDLAPVHRIRSLYLLPPPSLYILPETINTRAVSMASIICALNTVRETETDWRRRETLHYQTSV